MQSEPAAGERGSDPSAAATPPPALEESGRRLVYLAAERTLLAWFRAAIALILLGFAVDRFGLLLASRQAEVLPGISWSSRLGVALIASGVAISALSALRYWRFERRYARGDPRPGPGIPLAIAACLLLAVAGAALGAFLWLAAGSG